LFECQLKCLLRILFLPLGVIEKDRQKIPLCFELIEYSFEQNNRSLNAQITSAELSFLFAYFNFRRNDLIIG